MVSKKTIKDFKNLDKYPELKEALISGIRTLPKGSKNTKVIISEGKIIERIYITPRGVIISLFPSQIDSQAA